MNALAVKAYSLRQDVLDIIMAGGGGHIGGDMSVIDALMVLYLRHLNVSPAMVAFGGNALGKTPQEQLKKVRNTAKAIADLVEEGYEIIITHGNGPQVGMINEAMEYAARHREGIAFMPFAECGAMSQGYIGYHLQQSIRRQLEKRGIEKGVVSVITQVAVDQKDPGFQNFTKPVGNVWYTKEKAEAIAAETGYVFPSPPAAGEFRWSRPTMASKAWPLSLTRITPARFWQKNCMRIY